ncbi:hypothetical protein M5X04_07370 [Paenibacillus alvei]|uniref:Uncharacterized protein n=1 Tax=Paenibacillus alvei TaxID=44250 RepID=A0ABT4E5Z1_PAEAL|nr:hypothetical protein [Paenibacillus alvei]MCY9529154.1 hypothetical protein [Paenibacillus alvei]
MEGQIEMIVKDGVLTIESWEVAENERSNPRIQKDDQAIENRKRIGA